MMVPLLCASPRRRLPLPLVFFACVLYLSAAADYHVFRIAPEIRSAGVRESGARIFIGEVTLNNNDKSLVFGPLLKLIGAYLIIVGASMLLAPTLLFRILGEANPAPLVLWRWLGVMAAAYGFGLGLAALQPGRNWRLLLVGFLSMLFVALLTLAAISRGGIGSTLGWTIIIINLIPLLPMGIVLTQLASAPAGADAPAPLPEDMKLDQYKTQEGRSLESLSHEAPVLLVLLRHLGCTFCRETLADIAARRQEIESAGARLVFVHMGEDAKAAYLFERYRLEDIPRISDPEAGLYRALGLPRASLLQVYGPGMWKYVIQSVLLDGHGMGQIVGDRFQMPGAFLIHRGSVVGGFRHQRISDHPDYLSIVRCASPAEEMPY